MVRVVSAAFRDLSPLAPDLSAELDRLVKTYEDEVVALRRDIHAHPELGRAEVRTTALVRDRLAAAGVAGRPLPGGTGLVCDIGASGHGSPRLALRADLDALPVPDEKDVPYRSTVPGLCHACGHDMHTAIQVGVGLVLAELAAAERLPAPVRLIFQPAEEVVPGGSHDVIAAGGLSGVDRIVCLHVDPRLDTGQVGLRMGAVTSACDQVDVRVHGRGGHTARPHLTQDLVFALATLVTGLPTALARRLDPRAGVSLVWGQVTAGHAANIIPAIGAAQGTIRCLDVSAWHVVPALLAELAPALVAPYGVRVEVSVNRTAPPVVNEASSVELLSAAVHGALGAEALADTEQSLGAEDFAWYLEQVPGALARLGVRRPGDTVERDLHQGSFDPDERAVGVGMAVMATAALLGA